MSKLILTGDTNNNFGKLLPAPYIDKIYINEAEEEVTDDGDTTTITSATVDVDIEIFIRAHELSDTTTIVKQMEDLRVHWFYGRPAAYDLDIDDFKERKYSIQKFWIQTQITHNFKNMSGFSISDIAYEDDGTSTHTIVYDEEGNRHLKFTYSSKDEEDSLVVYNGTTAANRWSEASVEGDETYVRGDVYLFVFAIFDTFDPDAGYWSGYDLFPEEGEPLDDRFGRFLAIETGDTTYDAVWIDGEPAWGEQVVWVDIEDNWYDDTPLQSLASKFYSIEKVTHSEIVSSFEELLKEYETRAETDSVLQDTMDQISYVLETEGAAVDLLSHINELGRAFPSKSSATATGLLYIDYKEKINATNAVIETGTQVFRRVVINPKVIDERTGAAAEWVVPVYLSEEDEDIVRTEETEFDADDYFVTNMKVGRTSLDLTDELVYNNYGYVYFDYDKAVYETADIGHYFRMDTIFNILGKDSLNGYFQLTQAEYKRYLAVSVDETTVYDEDTLLFIKMTSTFEDGYDIDTLTWEDLGTPAGWVENHSEPYIYDTEECVAYSFVLLRNFELAREEGWDGYRMMCFEFQDFENRDTTAVPASWLSYFEASNIKFTTTVNDNTANLVYEMINMYKNIYDGGDLSEYIEDAEDLSNYNYDESAWTDSFQTLMHDTYDSDTANAPWILYPAYYCVFLDLATHEFEGDLEKIKDEVNRIVARINPYNGSLTELQSFAADFASLYEDTLTEILAELPGYDEGDPTPSVVEKTYSNTFGYSGAGGTLDTSIYDYADDTTVCEGAAYASEQVLGTIEPSNIVPADGSTGQDPDTTTPVIWYNDHGSDESSGFYFQGVQVSDAGWTETGGGASSYFSLQYKYDIDPSTEGYLWKSVDWEATYNWEPGFVLFRITPDSSLYGYDDGTGGVSLEYRLAFENLNSDWTDEHGALLSDYEIFFKIASLASVGDENTGNGQEEESTVPAQEGATNLPAWEPEDKGPGS